MKKIDCYVPVSVEERLPVMDCAVDVVIDNMDMEEEMFTVQYSKKDGFWIPGDLKWDNSGVKFWLEKKEQVYVLKEEEIEVIRNQSYDKGYSEATKEAREEIREHYRPANEPPF